MAASFARTAFFIVTIFFWGTTGAEDNGAIRKEAAYLANENLLRSLPALQEAMASCKKKRRVLDLPHSDTISVSRENLLLALTYFHLRNNNACIAPAAKDVFLAASVVEKSQSATSKNCQDRTGFELIDSVLDNWWQELEAKARYQTKVAPEQRAVIEQLPGIDQPFDMIQSWNASGN